MALPRVLVLLASRIENAEIGGRQCHPLEPLAGRGAGWRRSLVARLRSSAGNDGASPVWMGIPRCLGFGNWQSLNFVAVGHTLGLAWWSCAGFVGEYMRRFTISLFRRAREATPSSLPAEFLVSLASACARPAGNETGVNFGKLLARHRH